AEERNRGPEATAATSTAIAPPTASNKAGKRISRNGACTHIERRVARRRRPPPRTRPGGVSARSAGRRFEPRPPPSPRPTPMSAAHLAAVLFSDHLRFDVDDPKNPGNDRFVLSKGHASPLLYSAFKAIGAITDQELLSFRKFGSPLQGHPAPVPEMPWVDVATGSLGQGLPIGLGMALAMRLDGLPGRVWVLMGDSEFVEGSVWETMANASYHQVRNLVAILDMNRLGQRGPTMLEWDGDRYAARAEAFGWRGIQIDGHDVDAIDRAYGEAS